MTIERGRKGIRNRIWADVPRGQKHSREWWDDYFDGVIADEAYWGVEPPPPPPPAGSLGPRYGPADWPGRDTTVWPAVPDGALVVPPGVLSGDQGKNLSDWLMTSVPNGTPDEPTVVVFDQSDLGDGTVYDLSTQGIYLDDKSRIWQDVDFWFYNSTVRAKDHLHPSVKEKGALLNLRLGGYERVQILGGEFFGPNTNAGTWDARIGIAEERHHGIWIDGGHKDIVIADTYVHHVDGDSISTNQWSPSTGSNNRKYAELGRPTGITIEHNHLYGSGRQGVNLPQGTDLILRNNEILGSAMFGIDSEDEGHQDPGFNVMDRWEITDNHIDRYMCAFTPTWAFLPAASSFARRTNDPKIVPMSNLAYRRNRVGSPYGLGKPEAEEALAAQGWPALSDPSYTGTKAGPMDGYHPAFQFAVPQQPVDGLIVEDNVLELPENQRGWRDHRYSKRQGLLLIVHDSPGVVVRGNHCAGRGIWVKGCIDPVIEGNIDRGPIIR